MPKSQAQIDAEFWKFHQSNPHVYDWLVTTARQLRAAGHRTFGMKAVWERLRWETVIRTSGFDFKLNNNYTSRYSRLIMNTEADLAGFFPIRKLKP
jgi:hypothetical protein